MAEKEYIERGDMVLAIRRLYDEISNTGVSPHGGSSAEREKAYLEGGMTCALLLEGAALAFAAADVVEVMHGEWKQTTEPLGAYDVECVECSICGESWVLDEDFDYDVVKDFWNYCPNCGAKMDGGEEQ